MLEPDRNQIETFVGALFQHAGDDGFVSLRAFYEDDAAKPFRISPTSLAGGLPFLIDAAEDDARRAANHPRSIVFCPPIAVFSNRERAREQDILRGLALSVECDQNPRKALAKLEQILGAPTIVAASGGKWTDARTGQVYDKLHLHWRLRDPATGADLAKLKQARDLATRLVGGDPSNKPVCHPIRWAGSWHRKAAPTLCRIEESRPGREIDLDAALQALIAASPQPKTKSNGSADDPFSRYGENVGSGERDWSDLVRKILASESYHEPLTRLAIKMLKAGMDDGAAVNMLRGLMDNAIGARDARWQARYDDIPRAVSTAREKIGEPDQHAGDSKAPPSLPYINMSNWDNEPVPEQEWSVLNRIPLLQCALFSGEGAAGKSSIDLHKAAAHVLGRDWLGTVPKQGPALFIDAEDNADVMHRRLAAIVRHYGVTFADLIEGGLHLISLAGHDAILATATRTGKIEPTSLYKQILEAAGDIKPVSIGIASSANVYAGSELDRSQVQQFIGLLTRLAIAAGGAVTLISHPSLTGIANDTGVSGSTQWHNAVRARFYLKGVKPEEGEETDSDLREIVFKKNNYGPISESIVLRYADGLFLPLPGVASLDRAAQEMKADGVFLDLLSRFNKENRPVSSKVSSTYAPALFAREREAKDAGVTRKALEDAMSRLFKDGKIGNEPHGKPSLDKYRIARK